MSISRRELILANIETVLNTITIPNGYENTLARVERWKQRGNSIKDIPCAIISAGREEKEATPYPQSTAKLTVFIDIWTRQVDTDTSNTDTLLDSLLLDIEKAVMLDYARGGYAENTEIRGITPFETIEGSPSCGLMIELEITYKHKQMDPALAT
jgi:hypothetical protein